MDEWFFGAAGVVSLCLAFVVGWQVSASTIAHECEAIGAFYVGKSVYACKPKPAGEGER